MVKKRSTLKLSLLSLITIAALGVGVAWASGSLPGGGWYTTETVQNVGAADGTVSVTAYDASSTASYVAVSSVVSNTAVNFDPSTLGISGSFAGSAIVSSDQPAVAVGTITNVLSGTLGVGGGRARERYESTLVPQKALYFPLVKNNWYGDSTLFYIQNAESSAIVATAVFKMDAPGPGGSNTYTYTTPSIGSGQMVVISPGDAGVPSNGNNGNRNNIGGLTVTSAGNMAGIYTEYINGQSVATVVSSMRGIEPTDIDITDYVPIIKRAWYGEFTGLSVLNSDSVPITVTASYVGTAGTCKGGHYTDTRTGILPGKSANIVQLGSQSTLPDNCLAAATITGLGADGLNKNIVTLVNESQLTGYPANLIVYFSTGPSTATRKVVAPIFEEEYRGLNSGIQLQNQGSAMANNVVVSFYCKHSGIPDYIAYTQPLTITAGGSVQFFSPSAAKSSTTTMIYNDKFVSKIQANSLCSVVAIGDQPLGMNINDESIPTGVLNDANYVGFNLTYP